MINDIKFAKQKEQSLDDWVDDTIAVISDVIYEIVINITQVLSEVIRRVR
ncbi:unnamed protein product [marine sediment metagenome]|uniref:Uncharacterized protein n=1 Tax=marine sediment metagenome TaxID=412755 RepID=X1QJW8_9ZZZZ